MDKRSHPISPNESNLQPASGSMSAAADIAGFSIPAASHGLLGLRAARRHCPNRFTHRRIKCATN
jgi:hypothetical protein